MSNDQTVSDIERELENPVAQIPTDQTEAPAAPVVEPPPSSVPPAAPVVEPAPAVAPELNYRVCAGGPYTQYDADGKANVYRIGDTIKLTEEAAVAHGEGCFVLA